MESLYILAAAAQRGIRIVAIRAISDGVDSTLPLDFNSVFNESGAVSIPKVIGQVVRKPGRIPGLIRLANESERAATGLAQFLEDVYSADIASGPVTGDRQGRGTGDMSHTTTQVGSSESGTANGGQMRAGVYRGKGRVVVEHVPIPEIGAGEVLFRVAACGICGTDIKKIHHGFIAPPQILGHELAGTVVKTGAASRSSRPAIASSAFITFPAAPVSIARRNFFRSARVTRKSG